MKKRHKAHGAGHKVKNDGLIKSLKTPFAVIRAEAGIPSFQVVAWDLDPDFYSSDDF